ncbi:4,5-DOPA-extradiol-dioxygenase [Dinghuibacter silviterrae]|uniref:4,5-DOPA dioxygenase extradiol n=1 Tax=Dinghuibacter silviterrae TaxID=1539049 RepID=A0A4R8DU95_9BACT|nr:4,5-DOPA dioxygenase extradiol [Dinghuibacter silviterrae]TDX00987.1 4,5-DOPA dioxygenase extradiol [Dinghuibacter silviterrae]
MNTLSEFRSFTGRLEDTDVLMPALFVGHGSPMNGIEDNAFSRRWAEKGKEIPTPKAVLCVSAHWFTRGTRITAMEAPPTIHDFYGFPPALSAVEYPAPGDPALAGETAGLLSSAGPLLDHDWGLDHGTWTITRHMYPDANIPVLQLSIDHTQTPGRHYELGRELASLRRKGILIIGSGNMVHNLRMMNWHQPEGAYDWAATAQERFSTLIREGDAAALAHYERLGPEARLAIPTPEHYLPLLYVLGLRGSNEPVEFFNDRTVMGSVSMTSIQIGAAGA